MIKLLLIYLSIIATLGLITKILQLIAEEKITKWWKNRNQKQYCLIETEV